MEVNKFTKTKNIAFSKIQNQNNAYLFVWEEKHNLQIIFISRPLFYKWILYLIVNGK